MKIFMIKGTLAHAKECEQALLQSELGTAYFTAEGSAQRALEEGFLKGQIDVAIDDTGSCVGFMWCIENGVFHSFPYLHIITVKSECRGQGIGSLLLDYFEKQSDSSKLFLVVADFNTRAKALYERKGYVQVGALPNLYREGITEYLMMKVKA